VSHRTRDTWVCAIVAIELILLRNAREQADEIRARADAGEKIEPTFSVDVMDEQNQIVAHVDKLLYVRKKKPKAE
jgi:hypothetical protein